MHLFIILGLIATTCAERPRHPMENPDLFQGDILLDDDDDRNALVVDSYKWPGGVIPYEISLSLTKYTNQIEKAMKYLSDRTCIQFTQRKYEDKNYLFIFPGNGCYSHWGKTGNSQPLSLGGGCLDLGTIMHELMHAIGFMHEQNRSDRDDYLIINWDNIKTGFEHNFNKLKPNQNWLINEFDYDSIMIYSETSFSKDGKVKTMLPKKKGVVLTDVFYRFPTDSDIYRINTLYGCKKN
ncbi:astacin-like metalloprotease toxin 1 [Nephila pilipes]|uniref:Metalloendopeptidase n=1 Tax=Nephila pilipes TaxID=299642 RepID=A0A8X6QHC7_NEPPI|nr:astacin-like metalloprotease toxin 1 [Nephila pilipes]